MIQVGPAPRREGENHPGGRGVRPAPECQELFSWREGEVELPGSQPDHKPAAPFKPSHLGGLIFRPFKRFSRNSLLCRRERRPWREER